MTMLPLLLAAGVTTTANLVANPHLSEGNGLGRIVGWKSRMAAWQISQG